MLALPGCRALIQRRRDGAEPIDAGEDVGVIDAAIIRPATSGLVGEMRHLISGGRVNHRRIGRQLRRRSGLAVSRDRAINQFWIRFMQRGVVELQSPHHARAEILDQHVRGRDEAADGLKPAGRFQIQHQAVLADIELAERGRAAIAHRRTGPHRLAFLGFDLDDLRPHVGQHPRAVGSGNRGREIEDAQTCEAACQIPLIVTGYGHTLSAPSASRPFVLLPVRRDPKGGRHGRKGSRVRN
jgi:hypothetical protein